jgi:transcriptional regulator with XRE-family HTH domain
MTGQELRNTRKRLALTQAELGEKLGISGNTIARWEREEILPQSAEMLRLAMARLEDELRANGHDSLERVQQGAEKISRIAKQMKANRKQA